MRRRRWALGAALAGSALSALFALSWVGGARGQHILQNGFEGREPAWVAGAADAPHKVLAHRLTGPDENRHGGQRCEHLQLQAEKGSYIHYTFDVGRAPINDDLHVSLWLRSNRPGVQLLCRVVLPRERDPKNVGQPLTVLVRCEPYQSTVWKLITLRQPVKRLQEQRQLLRYQHGRDVVTADAYIDQLVLNVYDGPGSTEVWVDDLEVGPVHDARPPARVGRSPIAAQPALNRRAAEVQLRGNQLLVAGERFFLRGIRHTGTPLSVLREAGFNTVWLDESAPPALVEEAVNRGFWLVPTVRAPAPPGERGPSATLTSRTNEEFARKVARFLDQDAVLCWDLGSNLGAESFPQVARTARSFRAADPMRPLAADVWDGFGRYSRADEPLLLGVHRWPLLTSLEMPAYRDWLLQRRRLAAPETFCWTWVQTHLPDWFLRLAYDGPEVRTVAAGGAAALPANTTEPLGPQAEQVRLLAYTALGCGFRGVGFWSDRFLADSHNGRDRLLALALLNQELMMLEPLLVKAKEPEWIGTSHPHVQAAVIRSEGNVLVLPIWMGPGSQFVPGQAAAAELTLVVPQVPVTAVGYEFSPGQVHSFKPEKVLGGLRVRLRNFSLTSAVVFTSDLGPTGLIVRLQDQQRQMAPRAAQWAHDQAQEEMKKVEQVQEELEKLGHTLPDGAALLKRAREALTQCVRHRNNGEHTAAYADAQVGLRALRVLMRAHWERAVRDLDAPVASPYAVSFFTLPRHYRFLDGLRGLRPAANALPDGDFEALPDQAPAGWGLVKVPPLDAVQATARRVADSPKEGRQCLMLRVEPKDPALPPLALERTFVAVQSPAVKLPPGTPVRVSAWVRVPAPIGASADGALLYDSAGGEPLAVRLTGAQGWKKYSLYRRVPASGAVSVTLALTGLGAVFFDDVRVEPLVAAAPATAEAAPAGR